MQIRFNSIGTIFVCFLVFIGFILNTQIEARTLSKNLRAGAVRNAKSHNSLHRHIRSAGDEQNDEDDAEEKRNENEYNLANLLDSENLVAKSNDDEDDDAEEKRTENEENMVAKSNGALNNDEDNDLEAALKKSFFNDDNNLGDASDEELEKRKFDDNDDDNDDEKKRK